MSQLDIVVCLFLAASISGMWTSPYDSVTVVHCGAVQWSRESWIRSASNRRTDARKTLLLFSYIDWL